MHVRSNRFQFASAVVLLSLGFFAATVSADILYVSMSSGGVRKVTPDGKVTPFVTIGSQGLAFDQSGNLYVADSMRNTIQRITPTGAVSQFVSGLPAEGLAFDSAGNLYTGSGPMIYRITPGATVGTFAQGNFRAAGLAFDRSGNLFAANNSDITGQSIIEVTPAGAVSTFARLPYAPIGLAFDSAGNLYASGTDQGTITEIHQDGTLSTFATGLRQPWGLAFDSDGNLYSADEHDISKITPAGVVSTFAKFPSSDASGLPDFIAVQIPEPSLLGLLAANLVLLRGRQRCGSKPDAPAQRCDGRDGRV